MSFDPAPIAEATAKLMDTLDEDAEYREGELVGAVVIAEVFYFDEDGEECYAYRWQSSHGSPAQTVGIGQMMIRGMLE